MWFFSRSRLTEDARLRLPEDRLELYERVWDESDYVIPPSENNAFFVMTNVVLTPNQTRTTCPEDPTELPKIICGRKNATSGEVNITEGVCVKGQVGSLLKSHGESTGNCILSDRMPDTYVCEIKGSDVSGFEKPSGRVSKYLGSSPVRAQILYFKARPKPVQHL